MKTCAPGQVAADAANSRKCPDDWRNRLDHHIIDLVSLADNTNTHKLRSSALAEYGATRNKPMTLITGAGAVGCQ